MRHHGERARSANFRQASSSRQGSPVDEIVKRFNDVFNAIDYHRYPVRDEATCRGFLQVLMIGADAVPSVKFHTALGRSDIQVDVGARRQVFELKYVQKDSEAPKVLGDGVRQARESRYSETFSSSASQTLLRSVLVFSAESRRFVCWASASKHENNTTRDLDSTVAAFEGGLPPFRFPKRVS